jgi:hypothetical protein
MVPNLVTSPHLLNILEELKKHEPIFHRPEFGTDRSDFENMATPEFWEVGASGKRYAREYVINLVTERYKDPNYANNDSWEATDFHCQEIAPDNYLLTYTLLQGEEKRMTRRSTIWRRAGDEWKIVYHQGTVIQNKTS